MTRNGRLSMIYLTLPRYVEGIQKRGAGWVGTDKRVDCCFNQCRNERTKLLMPGGTYCYATSILPRGTQPSNNA